MLADEEPFATIAKSEVTKQHFADREVACVTAEGLLLLKLYALPSLYRQGQLDKVRIYDGDIAGLLQKSGVSSGRVLERLKPYLLESDIAKLERVVAEIERRYQENASRFRSE